MNQKKIRYYLICIRLSTCKIRRLCLKYREDLNFYFSSFYQDLLEKNQNNNNNNKAPHINLVNIYFFKSPRN